MSSSSTHDDQAHSLALNTVTITITLPIESAYHLWEDAWRNATLPQACADELNRAARRHAASWPGDTHDRADFAKACHGQFLLHTALNAHCTADDTH